MSDTARSDNSFIGYEYKDITVNRDKEAIYSDGYENFGWKLESVNPALFIGGSAVNLKFKRDRKIRNKAELTRLQRQFDACISEISSMEKSKATHASIIAYTIGLIGTAFLAGATFAYLGGVIALCIIMAIPGFLGWIIPYFAYNAAYAKRNSKITPLVESKYEEVYEVCEKANNLL